MDQRARRWGRERASDGVRVVEPHLLGNRIQRRAEPHDGAPLRHRREQVRPQHGRPERPGGLLLLLRMAVVPRRAHAGQMATQFQTDLSTALGWAAQRRDLSVTPARFIVGEFGAPRDREDYGECNAMSHIATLIGAVPAWGAARAIFSQIIDNPPPATTLANAPGVRGRSPTSVAACPSRSLNKRPRRIPRRNSREDLDEPGVGTTGSTMRTAPGRLSRWLVQRGSSSWAARARGSSADGRAEKQCRLRRGTLRTWLHSARSARCAR